jgi:AcrR family transcriptional regulator
MPRAVDSDLDDGPQPVSPPNLSRVRELRAPTRTREADSDTFVAIVNAAIEILDEAGEHGLRIAEVSKRSGASIGSIYHFFGSRDGLVKAARARQFRASHSAYGHLFAELAARAGSAREFVTGLGEVLPLLHSRERGSERLKRFAYIGSAATRPDLLDEIRAEETALVTIGAELATVLIDRGWVKKEISARALTAFSVALELGAIVLDLDEEQTEDEWWRVVQLATESLFDLEG